MVKILVVAHDPNMREVMEIMLLNEGHDVRSVEEPLKAIELCKKKAFDLVLTELKMPKVSGIELLKIIKDQNPDTMVILITAYASGETAINAMEEGAYDYVDKVNGIDEIKKVVHSALVKKGLIENSKELEKTVADKTSSYSFCGMIGINREMRKIFDTIKKVSDTPANVLILGEMGTGKKLVAQAIHDNSALRSGKPFVVINCASISDNILENELFGYLKGAFKDANADKSGIFELANGGTIFFDEVADLSPSLQSQLLRVVQEKTFRRIGSVKDINVDVRIISATHKNLKELVKKGEFRKDLYYGLNVISIFIPLLKERREDIPLLINSFIDKYSQMFGKQISNISSYAMELLTNYDFPGNVRELQNIIERGVAMESSNIILPESLSFDAAKFDIDITDSGIDLNIELDKFEKGLVEKALQKAKGSKKKAADLLKISFDSLRHRIDKLGIE